MDMLTVAYELTSEVKVNQENSLNQKNISTSLLTLMGAYREEPDYTMLSNLISVMTNDYSTLVNTCFSLYYFQYEDEEDIHVFLMLVFLLAITG